MVDDSAIVVRYTIVNECINEANKVFLLFMTSIDVPAHKKLNGKFKYPLILYGKWKDLI